MYLRDLVLNTLASVVLNLVISTLILNLWHSVHLDKHSAEEHDHYVYVGLAQARPNQARFTMGT